jgi:hypothetical protein
MAAMVSCETLLDIFSFGAGSGAHTMMINSRSDVTYIASLQVRIPYFGLILAISAAILSSGTGYAGSMNHRTENEWTSAQKSSLGNIGVLSENFTDQFFSDPSMQARKKGKFDLQLMSLNAYYTDDLAKTGDDAQSFIKKIQSSDSSSSSLSKGVDALEFVASLTGRRVEAGATLELIAARIGAFTLIPYVTAFAKAQIDVPSWPQAEVLADQYSAVGLGYSYPLGKSFDIGANLRPGLRVYLQKEISASSLDVQTSSSSSGSSSSADFSPRLGVYLPLDLGVGYSFAPKFRAHLVGRNVYGGALANLSSASSGGGTPAAPPDYPLQLATGATFSAYEDKSHRVRFATEVQDVTDISGLDELWLRWQWAGQYLYTLSFRSETSIGVNAGLQSGYPSIGLLLDLYIFKVEGSFFSFEGGAAAGQKAVPSKSYRIFSELSF